MFLAIMFAWTFSYAESRPTCSLERCGSFSVYSRRVSLKPLKAFLWVFPDHQDHPKSTWVFSGIVINSLVVYLSTLSLPNRKNALVIVSDSLTGMAFFT